jgi:hypothetical protein
MARPISRVSRVEVTGPLAPFAEAYEAELSDRGYAPRTIINQLRQVARLSRWLEASGLTAAALSNERRRELFLRARAPISVLGRGGVSAIVRRACASAGLPGIGGQNPACYRASWQLPGRDSHPQATTSLR